YQATLPPRDELDRSYSNISRTEVIPSPDGSTVIIIPTDEGQRPFVIDLKDGTRRSQWPVVVRPPFAARPDGSAVAVTTGRGDVSLLDWHTGENKRNLIDRAYPSTMAWSPDGECLAVAMSDTTVMLIEIGH